MNIGFIGLGIMGRPMAKNLVKAGHHVTCFDRHPENIADVVSAGGFAAANAREAAEKSELVITMVQNSPQVRDVLCSENGVLAGARPGTIVVDTSSIAPLVSRELCGICAEKGVKFLDAPVSGGEPKAIDGTLSFMVGGEKEIFDKAYDVLKCMGASVVHCGDIGAGNTTKLANQIVVALNIAAVSEAFMLAEKAGVDPEKVFDAIKGGLAGSTVMNAKVPMILDGNFNPGFRIDLHIKDLNNAIDTAHGVGSPLPLTSLVMDMLQTLHADECGSLDHSAIMKYYEKISGTEVRRHKA